MRDDCDAEYAEFHAAITRALLMFVIACAVLIWLALR